MKQLIPKKFSSRLMAMTLIAGILPIAIFGVAITLITRDLPREDPCGDSTGTRRSSRAQRGVPETHP